jgi:hypothetical protein
VIERSTDALAILREGAGEGVLALEGDSMRPTLEPGCLVRVDLAPFAPRFGDLLLFRQQDYLTVHRFLGRRKLPDGSTSLRTRGDARPRLDPPLDPANLLGRIVAVRRNEEWRSLDGSPARAYALALGLHALAWAGLGVVAGRLHARLPAAVAAADRFLLRVLDGLLWEALHRRLT